MSNPWTRVVGDTPLIATAIHDGHEIRPEALSLMEISEAHRLREEDPFTGPWTQVAETRIVLKRSRFGVDMNRPRENAVYISPEDAWGIQVWKSPPSAAIVEASLAEYDAFYDELRRTFEQFSARHKRFVVFDIHSYNHRRDSPEGSLADPAENPEVNIGTGTMERQRWARLIDRFIGDLNSFDFGGRQLDVRENVKFQGGHMSKWAHSNFADSTCVLAIEFKKFFMNEWTGELFEEESARITEALRSTVPGVLEELTRLGSSR